MPNIGKYMLRVLDGESNGPDKDKAWAWKTKAELDAASPSARREFRDAEDVESTSRL